jgi:hypothetical protein
MKNSREKVAIPNVLSHENLAHEHDKFNSPEELRRDIEILETVMSSIADPQVSFEDGLELFGRLKGYDEEYLKNPMYGYSTKQAILDELQEDLDLEKKGLLKAQARLN